MVEQCPFKAWVAGSNPAALTMASKFADGPVQNRPSAPSFSSGHSHRGFAALAAWRFFVFPPANLTATFRISLLPAVPSVTNDPGSGRAETWFAQAVGARNGVQFFSFRFSSQKQNLRFIAVMVGSTC